MKFNIAGFSSSKTKINKDYDVNTTAEIGELQPILCEEVIPQSTYNISDETVCQVAPLQAPSFCRMKLVRYNVFVPMKDVFHHYDEVLTGRKITHGSTNSIVSSVPCAYYNHILSSLIKHSVCTVWTCGPNIKTHPVFKSPSTLYGMFPNISSAFSPSSDYDTINMLNWSGSFIEFYNYCIVKEDGSHSYDFSHLANGDKLLLNSNENYVNTFGTMPTIDDADIVLRDTENNYFCFRLTKSGRLLRKILIGLGLNFNFETCLYPGHAYYYTTVNILPILAYYKAWFDLFYPKREINFANTNCGKLISYFDSNSFGGAFDTGTLYSLFMAVLDDLANTCYISGNDYYTSHLSSLASEPDKIRLDDGLGNEVNVSDYIPKADEDVNSPIMKLVTALNNHVLSGTIIGRRVNDYLRQYGVNCNDDENNYLGSNSININIGYVLSNNENENVFLGQKAGQAVGHGNSKQINFTAKEHGYLISLIGIIPYSSFNQGLDNKFLRKTRYDFYNQQFDGLGYRLTPYTEFKMSNSVAVADSYITPPTSIGYTGRYNDYKYSKNIANSDFTRRGSRRSISAFFFDKMLPENDIFVQTGQYGDYNQMVNYQLGSNPAMSPALRECREHLYFYNRIFVNRNENDKFIKFRNEFDPTDDHFIIGIVNDFKAFMPVKPISDSIGADDLVDNKDDSKLVTMS